VGEIIFLREKDLLPLEKDEYYYFHITGCSVILTNGVKIGEVENLINVRDNELLVVRGRGSEIYIPFTADICREVNLNRKEIVIDPPKGLLDLNEI
jgi:16S rRNA processing protein RimM